MRNEGWFAKGLVAEACIFGYNDTYMTLEALRALLTRRPFEALRVKTSGGETFEIRHPEMAALTKGALVVVHADANGNPSDKVEYVSYLHVSNVETVAGTVA